MYAFFGEKKSGPLSLSLANETGQLWDTHWMSLYRLHIWWRWLMMVVWRSEGVSVSSSFVWQEPAYTKGHKRTLGTSDRRMNRDAYVLEYSSEWTGVPNPGLCARTHCSPQTQGWQTRWTITLLAPLWSHKSVGLGYMISKYTILVIVQSGRQVLNTCNVCAPTYSPHMYTRHFSESFQDFLQKGFSDTARTFPPTNYFNKYWDNNLIKALVQSSCTHCSYNLRTDVGLWRIP